SANSLVVCHQRKCSIWGGNCISRSGSVTSTLITHRNFAQQSRSLWWICMTGLAQRRGLRVKMILPALTEATSPFFRPIKDSLFPPLGLATLAGHFNEDDEVSTHDEHVEKLKLDDQPDLVVIQV